MRRRRSTRTADQRRTHAQAVLKLCNKAGWPCLAAGLIARQASVAEVRSDLERARSIQQLCEGAGLEELASGLVRTPTVTVTWVREYLENVTALMEGREIPAPGKPTSVRSATEIYAERNVRHYGTTPEGEEDRIGR